MTILDRLNKQTRPGLEAERTGAMAITYISELARHYRDRLIKEANLEKLTSLPPQVLRARVESLVNQMVREEERVISLADRAELIRIIIDETTGYGPLEPLIRDPGVTEIMVNAPDQVWIERDGRLQLRGDISFTDERHINHIIDRIVAPLGRRIDESSPMVDARLPDGSRVNAIIPPLSLNGPVITIRRFRKDPFTMEHLAKMGTLTQDMADFLKACVIARLNILVCGGTGSGKTTTLNVLGSFIPKNERIITIEDAAELQFYRVHPHVLRQEARPPNVEGKGEVTIRQLVRNSLRMRPTRIIVGEVRGAEALDMLQAMNTGHEGSMTTVHANSPEEAFSRLETMVMWAGTELPSAAIREQLVGALDIVVQQNRLTGGPRKIVTIAEVQGVKKGQIVLKPIFLFEQIGLTDDGKAYGNFTPTGITPKCLPRLKAYGVDVEKLRKLFVPAYLVAEMGTELLKDPDVTEIMVNGPEEVYIDRKGHLERRPDIRFRDETHLRGVINTIVAPLGRRIDESSPMVDARLPDGSRVNAVLPPLALNGPVLTIRRFREIPFTVEDIVSFGTMTQRMADFLHACVRSKLNILISGGTGSGKTTTLNVLSSFIPQTERIVTIEDAAELRLQQPHIVRMETRPPNEEGEGEITIRQLVRNSLRMRPDRIVVGEVRGAEALDMLQAMNTGHEGSLSTIHANSPEDAFSRLETMVMWAGVQLPSSAIREQLVGALNIVLQQSRLIDGSRRVTNISEIQGVFDGHIAVEDIFIYRQEGVSPEGRVIGHFEYTGYEPKCLERFKSYGVTLPPETFQLGSKP